MGPDELDHDTVDADTFGRSLRGLGLNLLVGDVLATATFLVDVFDMSVHQPTADFAILRYGTDVLQLHSDGTYHSNPLPTLLVPESARGAGAEVRLYDTDPDLAAARAEAHDHPSLLLQPPSDKPHGLRECYILDQDGYAWVPSLPSQTS